MENEFERENAKEIAKAVAIAALSAVAVDILKWGLEELRDEIKRRKEAKKKVEDVP